MGDLGIKPFEHNKGKCVIIITVRRSCVQTDRHGKQKRMALQEGICVPRGPQGLGLADLGDLRGPTLVSDSRAGPQAWLPRHAIAPRQPGAPGPEPRTQRPGEPPGVRGRGDW